MVSNVSTNAVSRYPDLSRQAEEKARIEFNNVERIDVDKIELSDEAKAASRFPAPNSKSGESAVRQESASANSQEQIDIKRRSKIFADVFLANFGTLGIVQAFDLAVAASRSAFSVNGDFQGYVSEDQEKSLEKVLEEYESEASGRLADDSAEITYDSVDAYY